MAEEIEQTVCFFLSTDGTFLEMKQKETNQNSQLLFMAIIDYINL
jgi:hypothetical protein